MEKSLKLIEYFVFVYRHCFVNQLLAAPVTATVLFKKSDLAGMMKYCNFMYYEYIQSKAPMRN